MASYDTPSQVDPWTLLDRIAEAAFVADDELRIVWANHVAEAFFGISLQQACGQSVLDLFPDTRGGPIEALYRAVLGGEDERQQELFYPRTERWLAVRAQRYGAGLVAFYRDVTRAHDAETELRKSEARYRMMAEHVSDVLSVSSPDGRCVWVSPSVEAALGYPPEALIGTNLRELIHPDDLARIDREARDADPHQPMRFTYRNRHEDGSWRWSEATGRIMFDDAGLPADSIFVARDVTERMETREALERSRDAAEAMARSKSAFLANVSHEIRTPMNGVIGMTSLLADTALDEDQRRFVSVIRSSGEMMLSLINDILDLSKIEAGKLQLEKSETDLRRVVEDALDVVAAQGAGARGAGLAASDTAEPAAVELISAFDPELPAAICTDATRLRQILVNLVGNGLKFTAAGEVSVHVRAMAAADGPDDTRPAADEGERVDVAIEVRDTGIGIAEADLERLFEPFTQLDESNSRRFGGSGLGLSISRRLAEHLGGTLEVESTLGVGSTFTLRFSARCVPPSRPPLPRRPAALVGRSVVVIDGNVTARAALLRQLEAWGMRASAFGAGDDALRSLAGGADADVALVDARSLATGDADLAARLAGLRPRLPILLLSSLGAKAESPHAAGHLRKPIKQAELFEAIAGALGLNLAFMITPPADAVPVIDDSGLRVLLAEDNAINQMVATLTLERLGLRADLAANGREVLEAMRRQPYDVILMDIQMPELDGIEATRALRALPLEPQPHIVAITAGALETERERALAAGVNCLLTKPFTAEELASALAERDVTPR